MCLGHRRQAKLRAAFPESVHLVQCVGLWSLLRTDVVSLLNQQWVGAVSVEGLVTHSPVEGGRGFVDSTVVGVHGAPFVVGAVALVLLVDGALVDRAPSVHVRQSPWAVVAVQPRGPRRAHHAGPTQALQTLEADACGPWKGVVGVSADGGCPWDLHGWWGRGQGVAGDVEVARVDAPFGDNGARLHLVQMPREGSG